jgi:hypothetical protein
MKSGQGGMRGQSSVVGGVFRIEKLGCSSLLWRERRGMDVHFIGTGNGMDVVDVQWKRMKRCWWEVTNLTLTWLGIAKHIMDTKSPRYVLYCIVRRSPTKAFASS